MSDVTLKPVSLEYLNVHYGLEEHHLPETGTYAILCKDDGSTDVNAIEFISSSATIDSNAFGKPLSDSFDEYGYEVDQGDGDTLAIYHYDSSLK